MRCVKGLVYYFDHNMQMTCKTLDLGVENILAGTLKNVTSIAIIEPVCIGKRKSQLIISFVEFSEWLHL